MRNREKNQSFPNSQLGRGELPAKQGNSSTLNSTSKRKETLNMNTVVGTLRELACFLSPPAYEPFQLFHTLHNDKPSLLPRLLPAENVHGVRRSAGIEKNTELDGGKYHLRQSSTHKKKDHPPLSLSDSHGPCQERPQGETRSTVRVASTRQSVQLSQVPMAEEDTELRITCCFDVHENSALLLG